MVTSSGRRNRMLLPPEMAAQYAEMAGKGDADEILGEDIFGRMSIFKNRGGAKKIAVTSNDPPMAHMIR